MRITKKELQSKLEESERYNIVLRAGLKEVKETLRIKQYELDRYDRLFAYKVTVDTPNFLNRDLRRACVMVTGFALNCCRSKEGLMADMARELTEHLYRND